MTGKTAEKLRSLLKTYDERSAARPPAEVRTAPDEAERRRRACGDRLLNVVRPVLQAFLTELKSAGHEGSIEDRTNTADADRKSTRLNSSHSQISYAVFCLKKKNKPTPNTLTLSYCQSTRAAHRLT